MSYKVAVMYKDGIEEAFTAVFVGIDPSGLVLCVTHRSEDKFPVEQTCILLESIKKYSFRKVDA